MTKKKLHPSVQQFKEFVKENPNIVMEVRKGNYSWQELYEDWYLLGEEDARWDSLKSIKKNEKTKEDNKPDWMSTFIGSLKKMDANQMQGYMNNLSQALSAIQGVISQFQGGTQASPQKSNEQKQSNPFVFRKD